MNFNTSSLPKDNHSDRCLHKQFEASTARGEACVEEARTPTFLKTMPCPNGVHACQNSQPSWLFHLTICHHRSLPFNAIDNQIVISISKGILPESSAGLRRHQKRR